MAECNKKVKRVVPIATFNKWQLQFDKDYSTLSWLRCDSSDSLVETLWCATCRRYESSIVWIKNFSHSWICGSTNQRSSNIIDHAKSEQHKVTMTCLRTKQARLCSYCFICPYSAKLCSNGSFNKGKIRKKI